MSMYLEFPVHEFRPSFYPYRSLVVLVKYVVDNCISLSFENLIIQILYGRYSLTPINSASVELLPFSFCLLDFACSAPVPIDIIPPVWLLILSCTAYAASIHVYMFLGLDALIIRLSFMVFLHYVNTRFNFAQSSWLLFDTLAIKNPIVFSMSGLVILVINSNFAVTE